MIVQMYMQYWIASAVLAAANLGVADVIDATPRDVEEIAKSIGADSECLFRLLRGLASVGVFREALPRKFVQTPLSATLRSDSKADDRAMIQMFGLRSVREAMTEYESAIRTGRSAFQIVHGTDNPFEIIDRRSDEADAYHRGMELDRGLIRAILDQVDFGAFERIVDVGGGTGGFLAEVLRRNPRQRGVLFDLPAVASKAVFPDPAVAARCEVLPGDMRSTVPRGGDAYVLKNILHGWPDDEALTLLQRIRMSAAPAAHVFIIENVMPDGNRPAPCKIFDLFLLLGGNRSRVRSEGEFDALLRAAGFELARVTPIVQNHCVIEASIAPQSVEKASRTPASAT